MNHDCPPKNTKTACTLDKVAERAFDTFTKGTPARKKWRGRLKELHPLEILLEITQAKADKKSVH